MRWRVVLPIILCIIIALCSNIPQPNAAGDLSSYVGKTAAQLSAMEDYVTIPNTSYWNSYAYAQIQQVVSRLNEYRNLGDYSSNPQAAVDSGLIVTVPPDTIALSGVPTASEYGHMELSNDMVVRGDGYGASVLTNTKSATSVSRLITAYTDTNIVIQGIKFVQDANSSYTAEQDHCITLSDVDKVVISDCYFDAAADGILIQGDSRDITINNCIFVGDSLANFQDTGTYASRNGIAIVGSVNGLKITNCTFQGFRVAAIDFEPSTVDEVMQNIVIANNTVRYTFGGGFMFINNKADSSCTMKQVIINGNSIDSTYTQAIRLFGAPGYINNFNITNNTIRYAHWASSSSYEGAIFLHQRNEDITIKNNHIFDAFKAGIVVFNNETSGTRDTERIRIEDNLLNSIDNHAIWVDGNSGESIVHPIITGNIIYSAAEDGDPSNAYVGIRGDYLYQGDVSNNKIYPGAVDSSNYSIQLSNCTTTRAFANLCYAGVNGYYNRSAGNRIFWSHNYPSEATYEAHGSISTDSSGNFIVQVGDGAGANKVAFTQSDDDEYVGFYSDGTVDGSNWLANNAAFTGTAEHDTVSLSGVTSGDIFVVAPLRSSAVTANDILSWEAGTDTLFVHRPAAGTSGLEYSYIRIK